MNGILTPARRPTSTTFNNIAEMLADEGLWSDANLLNAYGTDGVRSYWAAYSVEEAATRGLVVNEDSILLSNDERIVWVRS